MNNNSKTAIALLAGGLVVAAVSSLTPSQVSAQEAKLMYACYMQGSGVVYRINPPDDPGQDPKLKDDCTGKKHVKFYWVEFVGADGKVGIGVPEPTAELDVAGDIHASGQVRIGNTIVIDDATNSITSSNDTISFGDEVLLTAGQVGIGTTEPETALDVAGQVKITGGSPGAGKVLTSDADGLASWSDIGGGGVTDHGLLAGLDDDDHTQYLLADGVRRAVNGFAVTGTFGAGAIPTSGAGARLLWYPAKAAFRVGSVDGTQWNAGSIGNYSTAMGGQTMASAFSSTAIGWQTTASGLSSTAVGSRTVASGNYSIALGSGTVASSDGDFAVGNLSEARGGTSTAIGSATMASGSISTAMGLQTTASGTYSTAMGRQTTAQAKTSLALGRFNLISGNPDMWVSTDPVLVVGNGISEANRSNALTLLKNGDLSVGGSFTADGDVEIGGTLDIGWEIVDVTIYASGGSLEGSAYCPGGKQVLGGGIWISMYDVAHVQLSAPVSRGWRASIHEDRPGSLPDGTRGQVSAICARVR